MYQICLDPLVLNGSIPLLVDYVRPRRYYLPSMLRPSSFIWVDTSASGLYKSLKVSSTQYA